MAFLGIILETNLRNLNLLTINSPTDKPITNTIKWSIPVDNFSNFPSSVFILDLRHQNINGVTKKLIVQLVERNIYNNHEVVGSNPALVKFSVFNPTWKRGHKSWRPRGTCQFNITNNEQFVSTELKTQSDVFGPWFFYGQKDNYSKFVNSKTHRGLNVNGNIFDGQCNTTRFSVHFTFSFLQILILM